MIMRTAAYAVEVGWYSETFAPDGFSVRGFLFSDGCVKNKKHSDKEKNKK